MKRFYKEVTLSPASENGYNVLLDGKPVRTPAQQIFTIKSLPLAETVADEWRAQKDDILPDTMPLSQMAMTLIDRVLPNREALEAEALGYIDTDLVCYRADAPDIMKTAQEQHWNPAIIWFAKNFGESVQTTTGLNPLTQSPSVHWAITKTVKDMSDSEFLVFYLTTLGAGSVILALAFVAGVFSPEQVFDAAFVEEKTKDKLYHSDTYGIAPDQERRMKALTADLSAGQQFLMLSSMSL